MNKSAIFFVFISIFLFRYDFTFSRSFSSKGHDYGFRLAKELPVQAEDSIVPLNKYQHLVKVFYSELSSRYPVSISSFQNLFGEWVLELEESIFFKECESDQCYELGLTHLSNPRSESYAFKKLKSIENRLSVSSDLNIEDILRASEITKSINGRLVYLEFINSAGESIVFELIAEDVIINDIYLDNVSVYKWTDWGEPKILLRPATILDEDGYTNVRSGKGTQYGVIHQVREGDLIFVLKSLESNWWEVFYGNSCESGFIHSSRVKLFNDLGLEVKNDIRVMYMNSNRLDYKCMEKYRSELNNP